MLNELGYNCERCHEQLGVDDRDPLFRVRALRISRCHEYRLKNFIPCSYCVSEAYAIADALERFPGGTERRPKK